MLTSREEAIARATFDRLLVETKSLGIMELVFFRSIYKGQVTFDEVPEPIRRRLARLGSVVEGLEDQSIICGDCGALLNAPRCPNCFARHG